MTKFTEKQISWAKSHDWFVSHNANGSITVMERYTIDGGPLQVDYIIFSGSFSEIKEWAGY